MKVLKFKKLKKKSQKFFYIIVQSKNVSVYSAFSEKLGTYFYSADWYKNKYFYININRFFFWSTKGLIVNSKIYSMIHHFSYYYEK